MGFEKFREDHLSTIEVVEEDEDSSVWKIGEECEHLDDFHREEGKDVASECGILGEKLVFFEDFCEETFAVPPTFMEGMMEESGCCQRSLEKAHEELGESLGLYFRYCEATSKLEKEGRENEVGGAEIEIPSMAAFL
nr:hypothetical protein HmN_000644700 [Hymenolepis microstoma]